jgi:hypothetical protein
MKARSWEAHWMHPTRANYDRALAEVWARDPDAVFLTGLADNIPVVVTRRMGIERKVPFIPGFVWGASPEQAGANLVRALKL